MESQVTGQDFNATIRNTGKRILGNEKTQNKNKVDTVGPLI